MDGVIERALSASFMELCDRKPVQKITVQDITSACGVSKQTFYNHFRDRQDLMNYVYEQEIRRVMEPFHGTHPGVGGIEQMILQVFKACELHKRYYMAIASLDIQNGFPEYYYDSTKEYYMGIARDVYAPGNVPADVERAIGFNCAGSKHMFMKWIRGGMSDSPEMIAHEIAQNMPAKLKDILEPR